MQKSDFSYKKCDTGYSEGDGYMATRTDGGFMSLRTFECEEFLKKNSNPLGWKFHISIDDERENMILAWDNIVPIFMKHKVNFIKLIRPECHQDDEHSESERGRQFTVYIEQNLEKTKDDWQNLINEITDKLVEKGIKPGYQNVVAKAVQGSSYFYYRNDKPPTPEAMSSDNEKHSPIIPIKPIEGSDSASTHTASSVNKRGVPGLNLQGILPTWTHKSVARAKDTYLDNTIKVKYNPSNSDERFLPELKVENTKQLEPKGSSEKNQSKNIH